jgi:drug/metabolite transporter (DMT)-like permease
MLGISVVIAMYALWSSMFSIAKLALQYSTPLFLTGTRMVLASFFILSYLLLFKPQVFRLNKKQILSLTLLGFFSIYLANILEFWALQYLTAAKTCFIYSLTPFFAALLSYIHFGEKMNTQKWLGLLLGFIGILPVMFLQTGSEDILNINGFLSWPTLAVMGAALFSVYGWVILRIAVKDDQVSPLTANGISMLLGGSLALIHSYFIDHWDPLPVATSYILPFMGWTGLMTMVSNLICYNLYGMMLKKFTATFLSFLGLLSPIFASLHGWFFLSEPFSYLIIGSTLLVSIGLWIVYSAELKQGYVTQNKSFGS